MIIEPIMTPIEDINEDNLMFGSIRVDMDPQNADAPPRVSSGQMPSLYFMTDDDALIRVRPFHQDGFGIFIKSFVRIIPHIGDGNPEHSFEENAHSGLVTPIDDIEAKLTSKADLVSMLRKLRDFNPMSTADFIAGNQAKELHNNFYITNGNLEGVSFYREDILSKLRPVNIYDEYYERRHYGHAIIPKNVVIKFYKEHLSNLHESIFKLSKNTQFINIEGANGTTEQIPIFSEAQYFPQSMIPDGQLQARIIYSFIKAFSDADE